MSHAPVLTKGPVPVTAAVIFNPSQCDEAGRPLLLIAQRLPGGVEAGKWEFPGGKVEAGESPECGLRREIKEELGIEIEVGEHYDLVSHVYDRGDHLLHVLLLFYVCSYVSGTIEKLQVADARWIRLEELHDYTFAAADLPVVERLLRNGLRVGLPMVGANDPGSGR